MNKSKKQLNSGNKGYKNQNETCYLSDDGRYYCYKYFDADLQRYRKVKYEVGKDITVELAAYLNETDHKMALNERYAREMRDPRFENAARRRTSVDEDNNVTDPIDLIGDNSYNPESLFLNDEDGEDSVKQDFLEKIDQIIDEVLTDAQKDLYRAHYVERKTWEEIRQEEEDRTGRLISHQAMTNRKKKILVKIAKAIGTTRVK